MKQAKRYAKNIGAGIALVLIFPLWLGASLIDWLIFFLGEFIDICKDVFK